MSTNSVSFGYLVAMAQRSMLESADAQRQASSAAEDESFRASIEAERRGAHAEHEKAMNDYYVSNVESVGKVVPLVGDLAAAAVTSGKDDIWLAGPVYAAYGAAREAVRAEYGKSEGGKDAGLDNPIARTMVYADRTAAIEHNDQATAARTEAKVLEKASNDAKEQRSEAVDLRRQTLSDARSLIEELRQTSAKDQPRLS